MLLSYYGDDFTGSTDVMEALASHGVKTVLFTRMPSSSEYRQFTDYQAVGLAGTSRSQTPEWMEENLRPALSWLKGLGAAYCHYKVCSTFDSSPTLGSIGKAIDIGSDLFRQAMVPLVVGAPQLKRYTAFGHLFAAYQGKVYRIDRHPVMSRHPVTPMTESDLTLHLALQTAIPVSLYDGGNQSGIVFFDVADRATQLAAGEFLLRHGPFVAGSSGVEYALLRAWAKTGQVVGHAAFAPLGAADRIAAVSGSCSPTTERQIRHALAHGFDGVEVDPLSLSVEGNGEAIRRATAQAMQSLTSGRSVIICTALGAATGRRRDLDPPARNRIGAALGKIIRILIEQAGLKRAIIAGGDTSSHALGALDALALTTRYPLQATPGSPLCQIHGGPFDGLEIAMKGGQVGHDDYFVSLRDGR